MYDIKKGYEVVGMNSCCNSDKYLGQQVYCPGAPQPCTLFTCAADYAADDKRQRQQKTCH